jgi:hypothetical protein
VQGEGDIAWAGPHQLWNHGHRQQSKRHLGAFRRFSWLQCSDFGASVRLFFVIIACFTPYLPAF